MTDINTWLQKLKDKDAKLREKAIYALGEIGDERTVKPLICMLEDPSSDVRKGAIVALAWIKNKKAVNPLLKYLKRAEVSELNAICYALGELGDTRAVDPLLQILNDETKPKQVHINVIRALGKINDKRAIIPLIEFITHKNNHKDVDTLARRTLDEMLNTETVKTLIHAFDSPLEAVKWFASKRLIELSEISFKPLVQALKEKSGEIRKYSIITLGEMDDPEEIDFLYQFISDDELKYYAAIALGKRGKTRVANTLLEGLTHSSAWVREHAALALGAIKDKKALDALITALKDTHKEVRAAAAVALGELHDEKAIEPLIQAMANETRENWYTKGAIVRESIAEALGKIGEPASEPLLKIVESKAGWNLRFFATIALAEMENKKGIEYLMQGVNDSFWFNRYSCARILRRLIKEKKIPPEKVKKPIMAFFDPPLLR